MELKEQIAKHIRNIPDFPKPGIQFKDITPLFKNPGLVDDMAKAVVRNFRDVQIDAVAGIESRGFLLGPLIATILGVPFVLIRKAGKLPAKTYHSAYELEYGEAVIEMHRDALEAGQKVLVHDDLLATGGTANATLNLLEQAGAECAGFSFIVNLQFLPGEELLKNQGYQVDSLVHY
ncbi:MAG: adenine phosphoribosyltransferase [Luteibaculaceae bacterium]|jgi:adenine phosphoribosyltransferase